MEHTPAHSRAIARGPGWAWRVSQDLVLQGVGGSLWPSTPTAPRLLALHMDGPNAGIPASMRMSGRANKKRNQGYTPLQGGDAKEWMSSVTCSLLRQSMATLEDLLIYLRNVG